MRLFICNKCWTIINKSIKINIKQNYSILIFNLVITLKYIYKDTNNLFIQIFLTGNSSEGIEMKEIWLI